MGKKFFSEADKEDMRINGYRMLADKDNSGEGYVCPSCGSGTGPKGTGLRSKDGIHYKCFACGWGRKGNKQKGDGDIFDYVGSEYGLTTFYDKTLKVAELMGKLDSDYIKSGEKKKKDNMCMSALDKKQAQQEEKENQEHQEEHQQADQEQAEKKKHLTPEEIEEKKKEIEKRYVLRTRNLLSGNDKTGLKYMTKRGFSKWTLLNYGIGYMKTREYSKQGKVCNFITIPVTNYYYIVRGCGFKFDFKRHALLQGFNVTLWIPKPNSYTSIEKGDKETIKNDKQVIVCEGCMDTLTCLELGFNSISLNSANNREKFVEYAKEHPKHEYIIELDNDKAGQDATQEIIEKLKDTNVNYKVLDIVKTFKGGVFKDLNACLMDDRDMLKNHIDNLLGRTGENESKKEKTA